MYEFKILSTYIAVILKWHTITNQYWNISFPWQSRNDLRYGIDHFGIFFLI